ncbi:hypothetical protein N7537_001891 [Penicillium hordei]|uniref:RING-type domain-containing protein n=1 Tax=Penicillium hordei TaxID=40994 RepID=A0AAD6EGB0_9EURO|nr:uncharacterized protein N7537_001891 [Penicillium hordei]KAJ5616777.1 hypothetical protein N7537_001891 [Penicillium hordei]
MDPNATDLETADLVLQTSLQEVRDEKLALLHSGAELRGRMRAQQDLRAALRISRKSRLDQAAILQDIHDREVNEAPAAHGQPQEPQLQQSRGTSGLILNSDVQTQTRKRVYTTTPVTVPPSDVLRECVACSESYPGSGMIRNSCSHVYCQGCVTHLLQNSLADESLFPPRCCRLPLPLEAARGIIDADLLSMEIKRHTYCSDPACSRYILPSHVGVCNRQSCILRKKVTHQGERVDDRVEVLKLGKAKGWQRCLNCSHLVELRSGCNHLTCRCRHEFCYVCSTPWEQCECAHWDEAMLQERAKLIAARNQPTPPVPQIVQRAAQFLIEQHDCYHDGAWKKLGISAECEECGGLMPDYIFEFRHCGLQACNSCRIHRF